MRLDDLGRPMAERRRVIRKCVGAWIGVEDEAVASPRTKTRGRDILFIYGLKSSLAKVLARFIRWETDV